MAKLILVTLALAALVACALAVGGVHDWAGNYYDATTGQVSSSLTGRVYNTRPTGWGPSPLIAAPAYHAPVYAAAPAYYASSPYVHSAYAYAPSAAYLLKK